MTIEYCIYVYCIMTSVAQKIATINQIKNHLLTPAPGARAVPAAKILRKSSSLPCFRLAVMYFPRLVSKLAAGLVADTTMLTGSAWQAWQAFLPPHF